MNNAEQQTRHARERALERYGLVLSSQDVLELAKLLKAYIDKPVGTVSSDGTITVVSRNDHIFPPRVNFVVAYRNVKMHVGYHPLAECISTVLEPFRGT